jgi:hypothetical protein
MKTLMLFLSLMLPSMAHANFCDEGSRREGTSLLICGTAEAPVRPRSEAITIEAVEREFAFINGKSTAKYRLIPRRLSCEEVYSDLYGSKTYWRCVRLVEYVEE